MEDKKSYYAIIPATVRYDTELTPNAKLLYGEITALCNEKGFCWATNEYFATLYGTSKRTVSRWITELTNKGYINIVQSEHEDKNVYRGRQICLYPHDKNVHPPHDKNVYHNNTYMNNTFNNKEIDKESTTQQFKKPTIEEIEAYIQKKDYTDVDAESFYYYYDSKQWFVGKTKMKNWKSAVSGWHARNKRERNGNGVQRNIPTAGDEYAFLG